MFLLRKRPILGDLELYNFGYTVYITKCHITNKNLKCTCKNWGFASHLPCVREPEENSHGGRKWESGGWSSYKRYTGIPLAVASPKAKGLDICFWFLFSWQHVLLKIWMHIHVISDEDPELLWWPRKNPTADFLIATSNFPCRFFSPLMRWFEK